MARRGHKHFTTWKFEHRGISFDIPVQLIDDARAANWRSSSGDKTYFRVTIEDPEIDERDSDINRLRETVFKKIREQLTIDWSSVLVVHVKSNRESLFKDSGRGRKKLNLPPDTPNTRDDASAGLDISWERWQIATFKRKKIARRFSNFYEPFGSGIERGEQAREVFHTAGNGWPLDKDATGHHLNGGEERCVSAMIPDTAENRLALESIADQLGQLASKLKFLMSGAQIEATLQQVATHSLNDLPAPPQKRISHA